ncbi:MULTISPECIES: flagellar filament capping protein FliD [unclassified Photobacterium]|uniref:flagellar filament capping protein FliD n=1 Tax=unclassified Photobacterium TaxID=2628852 RepID=UPI001EDF4002|nr:MULTISPECIES: flagellar filament capping protein FliD [unclassified Photobacterium]MCG3864012.1 flagellar filament capping protein FliD [Photobacterium sp. Ph6]MCG3875460.1 flagellar filament capping protein FliD [Photobacterium sp. Ph5]
MNTIDPAQMAQNLATADTQKFQQRAQFQADKYQSQLTALGKVESALRDFRSTIQDINSSTTSIIQNRATLSDDSHFSVSANAKALSGSYQVFVEQIASAHQVKTGMPANLESTTSVPNTGTLSFTVDGQTLDLDLSTIDSDSDGQSTISELTTAINNHPDNPGVNATLVRTSGQTHFMLASNETGVANTLSVSSSTGTTWFDDAFTNLTEISAPQDAVIWLGAETTGLKLTNSSNTFSNVIDGIDITATKAQTSGDPALSMAIDADQDATLEQVNTFIESYNKVMSTLDSYTQTGSADTKRGALANDPTLRSIESQLNNLLRDQFEGKRLSEIGISLNREGKLEVDKDSFKNAQQTMGTTIESMFNGDGNLLDSLEDSLKPFLQFSSGMFTSRKEALRNNIDRIDDKQVTLDRKYDMTYTRYLKQFTQMNQIMTQMQQTQGLFG